MAQLIASLLCCCLLVSPLTGCAGPDRPEPPGTAASQSGEHGAGDSPQAPEDTPLPESGSAPEDAPPLFPVETPVTCYPSGESHKITLLMYHHLVEREEEVAGNGMVVTARRFAQDLDWLADSGYTTVLPRDLVEGEPLPDKAVLITLDDGYRSNYTLAFPLLRERKMKAAIALICGEMDKEDPFYLTWGMCREMAQTGLVEFGSHTYWLHNLDERGGGYVRGGSNGIQREDGEDLEGFQTRVLDDLEHSVQRIEEEINAQVLFFAYPYGATEPWAEDFISRRFAMTFLTRNGVADLTRGFYGLPRRTVDMDRPVKRYF